VLGFIICESSRNVVEEEDWRPWGPCRPSHTATTWV